MKQQLVFRRAKIDSRDQETTGVAKWAAITACGILFFDRGHAAAYAQRGYEAIGGEIFLLFLPLFWLLIEISVKEGTTHEHRGSTKERQQLH